MKISISEIGKYQNSILKSYLKFEEELYNLSMFLKENEQEININKDEIKKEIYKIAEESFCSVEEACIIYKNKIFKEVKNV